MGDKLAMIGQHDRMVLGAILNPLFPEIIDEQVANSQSADQQAALTPEQKQCQEIEILGIKAAEAGDYEKAVQLFTDAIAKHPDSASCYNNRAQAHRLLRDNEAAMCDLNKTIELTKGKGKSAAQAFTQRAMLHKLQGDNDKCKADYESASTEGCVFAKNQLIMLNPYAAMCNQMLSQVIGRLQRGEPEHPDESRAA